ncbi:hypothetical protein MINTMi27_15030 [Mycobacterium intracellulare]|uniref:hypothetical protein n=1 Tax=Mycobacterium intracellulare TaxID=1767 RepID=UPI0019297104|nr:hypothetical protein [Mycobacterium intracellulare]BCP41410.1 hypothetical protein MINTMi27_15030 [Mycobacterium intracellulare]
MLGVVIGFASLTVLWSLWTRRHAWKCRWETASTVNVALLGLAGLLINRPTGEAVAGPLRLLTGQANMRFHVAVLCLIAATSAGVHGTVAKLMDKPSFRWWIRTRIQLPVAGAAIILTLLFVASRVGEIGATPELLTTGMVDRYLAAYWAYMSAFMLYLLWHAMRAYVDLWYDHESRRLIYPHMLAAVSMGVAMTIRLLSSVFWPMQTTAMPTAIIFGYIAVGLYSLGSAFCWISRVGSLTGHVPWTGSVEWPSPTGRRNKTRQQHSGS